MIPPEPLDAFLRYATWDDDTHGPRAQRMADRAAQRLLALSPDLATASLPAALICGEVDAARAHLAAHPEAATAPSGPRGWTPLLTLSFTRLSHGPTHANALRGLDLLLAHGARAADHFMAEGPVAYTALVGAAGGGEQVCPRQPQGDGLYRALLAAGAGPFDVQVLYNTHFKGDLRFWLEATFAATEGTPHHAAWADPRWGMLDMGAYGCGSRFVLRVAVDRGDVDLARWALTHGAMADPPPGERPFTRGRLVDEANRLGQGELVELFARHGASPGPVARTPVEALDAQVARGDGEACARLLAEHPALRASFIPLTLAARRDQGALIDAFVDLGAPLDAVGHGGQTALHAAAAGGHVDAARRLVARGAAVDPVEGQWGATPLGMASWNDHLPVVALLAPLSADLPGVVSAGAVDRARALLAEDPSRARRGGGPGILFSLPDDEAVAIELAGLLRAAGADAAARDPAVGTPADYALRRGLPGLASALRP